MNRSICFNSFITIRYKIKRLSNKQVNSNHIDMHFFVKSKISAFFIKFPLKPCFPFELLIFLGEKIYKICLIC